MSGPTPLPRLSCRNCGRPNPWIYLALAVIEGTGTCISMDCARARGWLDRSGNLKPGIAP